MAPLALEPPTLDDRVARLETMLYDERTGHQAVLRRLRVDRGLHFAAYVILTAAAVIGLLSLSANDRNLRATDARSGYGTCIALRSVGDGLRTYVNAQTQRTGPPTPDQQARIDEFFAALPNPTCHRPSNVSKADAAEIRARLNLRR